MKPTIPAFDELAPTSADITDYDRRHIKLYMRLLDATADGANWTEAVEVLFGIDPSANPIARGGSMTAIWRVRAG